MIKFPTLDEALELYHNVTEKFGGTSGVRDLGLLESALFRPQSGYYDDIIQMAAALMESLIINHPFIDGNKRMAFFLTDIFLRINGLKIKTSANLGVKSIESIIADNQNRFDHIEKWLRVRTVRGE